MDSLKNIEEIECIEIPNEPLKKVSLEESVKWAYDPIKGMYYAIHYDTNYSKEGICYLIKYIN